MPDLDVTFLLSDPDFCQPLTIIRRTQTVGSNGRATITNAAPVSPAPLGVILSKDTAIGGNVIEREPDKQYRGAAIDVYTTFRLRCLSDQYQPDVIMYKGDPYMVVLFNDYSEYGAGFIHAECTSMPYLDTPPS